MVNTTLRAYLDELNLLLEQEALEEVIGHCRHILQHFPRNVEAYRLLGRTLLEKGRHDEAGDVFQRVLSALPDDFVSHLGLSSVAEEHGDVPTAIWHLERAYEQEPNNMALQGELKRLYERRDGNAPDRIQLTPGALVRIYVKGRLYEQAINELRTALQHTSNRVDLQLLQADVLWNSDHPVEAGEVALHVLEKFPNCVAANRLLASLWLRSGRPSEAEPFISRLEQLDPFLAWEVVQPDGKALPPSAFQLPHLEWDARAAALLATDVPDWVSAISNVFEAPQSIPLTGGTNNWLADAEPGQDQTAPAASKPFEMPDWMADMPAPSGPVAAPQSDVPDWFKDNPVTESASGVVLPDWFEDVPGTSAEEAAPPAAAPGIDASWLDEELGSMSGEPSGEQLPSGFTDLLMGSTRHDTSLPEEESASATPIEIPDWLADAAPLPPSAAESPESAEALSWLPSGPLPPLEEPAPEQPQAAGSGESPVSDISMDWLSTVPGSAPVEPTAEPAQATDSGLDWLSGIPGAEPAKGEAAAEPADISLDWLSSMPGGESAPAQPTAEPAQAGDSGLDWLSMPSTEQPTAESSSDMFELRGLTESSVEWSADEAVPEEQLGDPLAWLHSDMAAEEVAPSTSDLGMTGGNGHTGLQPDDLPIEAEPPDWLHAMAPSEPSSAKPSLDEVDFSSLESASESALMDWELPTASSEQPASGEDWLSSPAVEPTPEQPSQAEPPSAGFDWLSQLASSNAEPVELEEDWLASFEAQNQPASVAPAEPEQAAAPEGWLDSVSPSPEEPAAAPAQEDWLTSLGIGQPAPQSAAPETLAPDDWLSSFRSAEASPVEPAEAAETPAWLQEAVEATPAPEQGSDWLPAEGKDRVGGLLRHATEKAAEPRTAKDTGVLDAGALPDWLSALGGEPAAQHPATLEGEQPSAEMAGPPDQADAQAESVPSWLSEMAPASGKSTAEPGSQPTPATPLDQLDFGSLEAAATDRTAGSVAQPANLVNTSGGGSTFTFDRTPAWMRKKKGAPAAKGGDDTPDWLKKPADSSGSQKDDQPDWLKK